MKSANSNQSLIQLMLKAQWVSQQDRTAEKGSAMVVASIVTLLMFSLLGACLAIGNLTKNRTNAFVDGSSTFYAAESGLNERIASLNEKLSNYEQPRGTSPGVAGAPVTAANIANCYSVAIGVETSNEFECRNYLFNSTENAITFASEGYKTQSTSSAKINKYTAYTFIADNTTYNTATPPVPILTVIPPGEDFEGLNSQNFKYTFYSTATKQDMSVGANRGDAATILQAETTIRRVPLFQFAYFSDIDMEFFVIGTQTTTGRVHTNGNLYMEHWGAANTFLTFEGTVSATGNVYNRQDSAGAVGPPATGLKAMGGGRTDQYTRVMTSSSPVTYRNLPLFGDLDVGTNPLRQDQLAPFNNKLKSGVKALKVPDMGFLRKRNYYTNNVSEYFGKADLRIEMFPDRAIPFAMTAIQTRTGTSDSSCVSTYTVGSDPAPNYIDPNRQKNTGESFNCTQLNKGQLMSLAQPVLMVARSTEEETRFCQAATAPAIERTRDIIGYAAVTADATVTALSVADREKVLRALQAAIAGSTTPIDYANVTKTGVLPAATQTAFGTLLTNLGLPVALSTASPASIAKANQSCFLPAPIAMVQRQDGTPGFFDRREGTLRTVLQTNLESLTIWNRDGRYVPMVGDLRTAPTVSASDLTSSVNNVTLYSTAQRLFLNAAANTAAPVGSFERLGLALADRTEGGLVLYATVNDNLSGDGSTGATNNIVKDTTKPIYKLNPDTTIARDRAGNPIILDYFRTGKGEAKGPSPNSDHRAVSVSSAYAFAVNGGRNVPGALTIATDRPMYLQGEYNTYANDRKPAAIIADTITALSGNCVSPGTTTDLLNIKTGQINCGVQITPATQNQSSPWTGRNTTDDSLYDAGATTQYNSAFVSNADPSVGNLGRTSTLPRYMGGGGSQFLSMLENWVGYDLNATGSFVWFGSTIESDGAFRVGRTYAAYGNTNYSYDTNFNSFDRLPPLTPMAIYIKQDVFRRKY